MTLVDDLKLIVVRDKWAMEDLVYDEATKEWNRLYSSASTKEKIAWLTKTGSITVGEVLNQAKALLHDGRTPVVVDTGSLKQDLLLIAKQYQWVFDELMLEQQEKMCLGLFKSANQMCSYLVKKKGSLEKVIAELWHLVHHQGCRRKTLHMVAD